MRHDEFAGNAYPQGEQAADQPIYPIMHRPAQIVPYGGYHQPQKMSFQTRLIASVLIAAVGIGGLYLWKEHEKSKTVISSPIPQLEPLSPEFQAATAPPPLAPPPTVWWIGNWKNANGTPAPSLQLSPQGTQIVGLLLRNQQKGFIISQPVRNAEASFETVLFHIEDAGLQQQNYHPLASQIVKTWYLFVQTGKKAELYRLPAPPLANVKLQNRGGNGPVIHPIRPTSTPLAVLIKDEALDTP